MDCAFYCSPLSLLFPVLVLAMPSYRGGMRLTTVVAVDSSHINSFELQLWSKLVV